MLDSESRSIILTLSLGSASAKHSFRLLVFPQGEGSLEISAR